LNDGNKMKKTERIREKMRKLVPKGYSAKKHLITLGLLTLAPIPFAVLALILWGMPLWALIGIPFGIIVGNAIEYFTHRWPMHRILSNKFGQYMYKRHAGTHHVMFQYDDMELREHNDLFYIMMTPPLALHFMILITTLMCIAYIVGGGPFMACVCITLCAYFFAEETLHASFHLKSTWQDNKWYNRLLRRFAEHHRIHLDTRAMRDWNFNIAFPLVDLIFRTRVKTRIEGVKLSSVATEAINVK